MSKEDFVVGLSNHYIRKSAIGAIRITKVASGRKPGQAPPEDAPTEWFVEVLLLGNSEWISLHKADAETMARNWINTDLM